MPVFVYLLIAWIALDVVLILAWHGAHVVARRGATASPAHPAPATQRVFAFAPDASSRARHLSAVPARRR